MRYASRKHAARFESFTVEEVGECFWEVRRAGGGVHLVEAFTHPGGLFMYCDCHDFNEYGTRFSRACMHIWKVYLTEAVWEC